MTLDGGQNGTSLAHTHELPEGARLFVWDGPGDYLDIVGPLPPRARLIKGLDSDTDMVHLFVRARVALDRSLRTLRATLRPEAVVWISWPKANARMKTDVNETVVRATADAMGFEGHKMVSVGEIWAALRLTRHSAVR